MTELERMQELNLIQLQIAESIILDLFSIQCLNKDGKFDHACMSSYEEAQNFLLRRGIIKKEDCSRD